VSYPSATELKVYVHCRGIIWSFGEQTFARHHYADLTVLLFPEFGIVDMINPGMRFQNVVHAQELAVIAQVFP